MIFTYLKIDNLYTFSDFELDLSIKRKITTSTIEKEYLINYPNFRFKKAIILSGCNASGKTSIGKVMNFLQNLITKSAVDASIFNKKNNADKPSSIIAEFYSNDQLHELSIFHNNDKFTTKARSVLLNEKDSYYKAKEKLKKIKQSSVTDIKKFFDEKVSAGWLYLLTNNSNDSNSIKTVDCLNENLLYKIMHSFDGSIKSVESIMDNKGVLSGFKVYFSNNEHIVIDLEANPTNPERMSTGTFHSIKVAYFVGRVLRDNSLELNGNIYFLDETMAYAHSELERSIVNLIIEKLGDECQFFYTTHNYDVLDMNLPIHSYAFLQKNNGHTTVINAEKLFNKNDRKLFQYVKNNFFNSLPDTDLIDELL